jgi:hypothetical protein
MAAVAGRAVSVGERRRRGCPFRASYDRIDQWSVVPCASRTDPLATVRMVAA